MFIRNESGSLACDVERGPDHRLCYTKPRIGTQSRTPLTERSVAGYSDFAYAKCILTPETSDSNSSERHLLVQGVVVFSILARVPSRYFARSSLLDLE